MGVKTYSIGYLLNEIQAELDCITRLTARFCVEAIEPVSSLTV